jgi:hypothetical protein
MKYKGIENWDIIYIQKTSQYLEKEDIIRGFKNQGLRNVEDFNIIDIETFSENQYKHIFRIFYSIKPEKKEMI